MAFHLIFSAHVAGRFKIISSPILILSCPSPTGTQLHAALPALPAKTRQRHACTPRAHAPRDIHFRKQPHPAPTQRATN
ncbi:hypothetical protein GMO_02050 [Gluconobacter morbifer G707]|uniref:Uncharacterized protein n=1 Tax=Gluconobacter morbifer G707 TaxID=1088869 RepID=G6XFE0_9PROT|nr:hypothetical protein GMO_02050 [Gluconobacter morbifer G707]